MSDERRREVRFLAAQLAHLIRPDPIIFPADHFRSFPFYLPVITIW